MTATPEQVIKLREIVAAATALLAEIQHPELTREGWAALQPNGKPPLGPQDAYARNGCAWNAKESRDLVKSWMGFTSVDVMAGKHRRTQGAIRSQLQHLLYAANVDVILDELAPLD